MSPERKLFPALLFAATFLLLLGSCEGQNPSSTTNGSGAPSEAKVEAAPDLQPAAYQKALESEPGILVDVRTPGEFSDGHLEGAINYPISEGFLGHFSSADKGKPVYVYCAVGARSARAKEMLEQNGFQKVINLAGGIQNWQSAGMQIVK